MSTDKPPKLTIQSLYDLLKADISSLKSDVNSNGSKVDDVKSSVASIKTELTDLNDTVSKLKTDFTEKIEENTKKVDQNSTDIQSLRDELKSTNERLQKSELAINYMGQRERRTSMKLNAFVVDDEDVLKDDEKLADKVYKDLLEPMFKLALDNNACTAIPTRQESVEIIHVLPLPKVKQLPVGLQQPDTRVPQIQVKFRAISYKKLICNYKKQHLAVHNGANGKTHMVDDRTPANGKCMAMLRADPAVDPMSVQLRNSRIRFKYKGENAVHIVKNPLEDTVAKCLKWTRISYLRLLIGGLLKWIYVIYMYRN